jgi:hypothetical protein
MQLCNSTSSQERETLQLLSSIKHEFSLRKKVGSIKIRISYIVYLLYRRQTGVNMKIGLEKGNLNKYSRSIWHGIESNDFF